MEKEFGPVIVGEWSLATDNCALWLNGFNDNLPGFPRLPCKYIPCEDPYMGFDQPVSLYIRFKFFISCDLSKGTTFFVVFYKKYCTCSVSFGTFYPICTSYYYEQGTPVDPGKPAQGPYGTGMSTPIFGLCPVGRDWLKESKQDSGKDWMKAPPEAPHGRDATDEVMTNLAHKKINAFSGIGHGFYFWNFRTDLYEPHWSYMLALERGWIPKGDLNGEDIANACHKEDNGLYMCVAKRNQLDSNIRDGINYVLSSEGTYTTEGGKELRIDCVDNISLLNKDIVANLKGEELYAAADCAYNLYWDNHRASGTTCDFGGTGTLVEVNITYADDDDNYDDTIVFGLQTAELSGVIVLGVFLGAFIGFATAMRCNKSFNRQVSRSTLGKSMSKNIIFSRSFGGFQNDDYLSIPNTASRY